MRVIHRSKQNKHSRVWHNCQMAALSKASCSHSPPSMGTITGNSANTSGPLASLLCYETCSSCPANSASADTGRVCPMNNEICFIWSELLALAQAEKLSQDLPRELPCHHLLAWRTLHTVQPDNHCRVPRGHSAPYSIEVTYFQLPYFFSLNIRKRFSHILVSLKNIKVLKV